MRNSRSFVSLVALIALAFGGCRSAEVYGDNSSEPAESGTATQGPSQIPTADVVPAGTNLAVKLNEQLGTKNSKVGDKFTATVSQPVVANTGETVIPVGSTVTGHVTNVEVSNHVGEQAAIKLAFDDIAFNGRTYPLNADITHVDVKTSGGKQHMGRDIGIGAAAGAVLGAVIGRSVGGALLGGALGAGAGTAVSLGTGDVQASLPAGTPMTIRTTSPINVTQPATGVSLR
jgi:hypothetical protein